MPSLAEAFLAGAEVPCQGDGVASLEAQLLACLDEARSAWPTTALDAEVFAAHLGERADGVATLSSLHAGDLYLACACEASLPEALAAFDAAFLAPIDAFVRRYDTSPGFADEVRQILRERFFVWVRGARPRIAAYSGRGALGAWVRVAAVRVALRLAKRAASPLPEGEALAAADPELEYVRIRYRGQFANALAEGLRALRAEDRNLLRLHFVDGLTIDGLAPIYHLHRATVARRLADAREQLFAATRDSLHRALGISGRELDSLVGLVRSRLDISLTTLFATQ